jgi:hypothetical protein
MRTSEPQTALIAALVKARASFGPIAKEATGAVGKDRPYKYADLAAILEAIVPGLSANGLVLLQSVDAESSSLITRLVHTSGEWVESVYPMPAPTTAQAYGSALTYGRRYSIQALLCLAASDDDGSAAESPKKPAAAKSKAAPVSAAVPGVVKCINTAQQKVLFTVAEQAGWSHRQIRDYLTRHVGVEQSKDIPVTAYDRLLADFDVPPDESASDPA